MILKKLKDKTKEKVIKQSIKLVSKISDDNIIKLTYLLERFAKDKDRKEVIQRIRELFKQKHPSTILIKKAFKNLSKQSKDKLITNLIINCGLTGRQKREEFAKKEGFMPPSFILISPTMRCNLNCIGCSTREYNVKEDLSFKMIDRIITEAKQMGIYFFVTLGGETFIKQDMYNLYKKHNDVYFQVYTNGTLINDKIAQKLAKLGNVAPMLSLEGYEKETDARRGKGVFKKVMKAMDYLREAGVLFGFSATLTRKNANTITSDKFMDMLIDKGCYAGWYFQYIPIGKGPDINLMPTPEQRNKLRLWLRKIRRTKPIFIGDFWNDGPYVGGCLAAGRHYFHINHKGDIEPCGFVHFATDNIKDVYKKKGTLKDVLKSDFFKAIRERQQAISAKKPYNDNLLTPCMIIDQPWVLRDVCKECHAYPTHPGADTVIKNPKIKKHLDKYSKKIHKLTDKIYEKEYKKKRIIDMK